MNQRDYIRVGGDDIDLILDRVEGVDNPMQVFQIIR